MQKRLFVFFSMAKCTKQILRDSKTEQKRQISLNENTIESPKHQNSPSNQEKHQRLQWAMWSRPKTKSSGIQEKNK